MSTIASITLTDSAAANFVFTPQSTSPFAQWIYRGSITSLGSHTISASLSEATSERGTNRVTLKFNEPREVTDSATGVTTVEDVMRSTTTFILPAKATLLNRQKFGAKHRDFIGETAIKAYYEDLEQAF